MLGKLISVVLAVALLVGLGAWAKETFFPGDVGEKLQAISERLDQQLRDAPALFSGNASDAHAHSRANTTGASISPRQVASGDSSATSTASQMLTRTSAPDPTPTLTVIPTATPAASPVAAPTPEATVSEDMDSAYISDILQGVNERRAAHGNAPLPLNPSLSETARDHAKRMAERGDKFHSGLGMPEDASYTHIRASASTVGAKATEHIIAFREEEIRVSDASATVITSIVSVGIGAVRSEDRVYTCILGEETVEFLTASIQFVP